MPGYDLAKSDRSGLAPKYICASCDCLLRDAMQTSCGHFYCLSCLDTMVDVNVDVSAAGDRLNLKCHVDGTLSAPNEVFPDNFMRREIMQLVVQCPYVELGCTWKGEVKDLQMHTKNCKFLQFPCRYPVENHLQESNVQDKVGEHREVKETVKLSERVTTLERHVAVVEISTGSSAPRSDESSGSGLPANELTHRVTNLENRMTDYEVRLVERNRNDDELRQQVNSLVRQFEAAQETIRRLERKVEDLEEFIRQQQVPSYDGTLLWKIDDYACRKNDAVTGRQSSFYSDCFYTSHKGYKMCARIYLNGDGMGKGTHISVFFVVMRGQFDAQLHWPFKQKVTIMILDQDNVEHMIDAFRPDPKSSSFQKPRKEKNVASGCPLFFSLADLSKHAHVRDDVMFIKIIVDTSDL